VLATARMLGLCALAASAAIAQVPGANSRRLGGIAGLVRDSLGNPLRAVSLFVDGSSAHAITDDSGRFDLRGLPAGKNGFTLTKIGYAPVSFETALLADSVIVVSIRMHSVQVLNSVNVSAARVNAYLTRTGFPERKRTGLGSFLTPEKIDSIAPGLSQPSDFLRDVRGIDLRCAQTCVVHTHFPPDCLWLFVDGAAHGLVMSQIDSVGITPGVIAAIEVYDRPAVVPAEFQGTLPMKPARGMTSAAGCGAVAIWTKNRIP
jgi:carboxypeptidase family protein